MQMKSHHAWTFRYLLKEEAARGGRCRSIWSYGVAGEMKMKRLPLLVLLLFAFLGGGNMLLGIALDARRSITTSSGTQRKRWLSLLCLLPSLCFSPVTHLVRVVPVLFYFVLIGLEWKVIATVPLALAVISAIGSWFMFDVGSLKRLWMRCDAIDIPTFLGTVGVGKIHSALRMNVWISISCTWVFAVPTSVRWLPLVLVSSVLCM